jgi:hypothetical protein
MKFDVVQEFLPLILEPLYFNFCWNCGEEKSRDYGLISSRAEHAIQLQTCVSFSPGKGSKVVPAFRLSSAASLPGWVSAKITDRMLT